VIVIAGLIISNINVDLKRPFLDYIEEIVLIAALLDDILARFKKPLPGNIAHLLTLFIIQFHNC